MEPPPDQSSRPRVAAARRADLRQLLPQLPHREIHALQPVDRPRAHRSANSRQPDVCDRQDRRNDEHRDASRRRQSVVRVAPPDLTVEARVRGAEWLYNYFLAFYKDDAAPSGWITSSFQTSAMRTCSPSFPARPAHHHGIQGPRRGAGRSVGRHGDRRARPRQGPHLRSGDNRRRNARTLSPIDYQRTVADLVNFLDYMAEPRRTSERGSASSCSFTSACCSFLRTG
jgi:hypothetical protein